MRHLPIPGQGFHPCAAVNADHAPVAGSPWFCAWAGDHIFHLVATR